jgi:hypothetical protein
MIHNHFLIKKSQWELANAKGDKLWVAKIKQL